MAVGRPTLSNNNNNNNNNNFIPVAMQKTLLQ